MPLLTALLIVNRRHGTTETYAVPLAGPPLWPILATRAGEALHALRRWLSQPIAEPSCRPRSATRC